MRYFVMVSQARDPAKVLCELSGQLWAATYSNAEIEAGKYRESLNEHFTCERADLFYVVAAYSENQCKAHPEFECFKDNRVTELNYERP